MTHYTEGRHWNEGTETWDLDDLLETTAYKGYLIEVCVDDTYDVMYDNELVDHRFKTIDEAKDFIDAQ